MTRSERLEEIRKRVEAATPGPWVGDEHQQIRSGEMLVAEARGWGHLTGGGALGLPADVAAKIQDANVAHIAHARQDIPWLLSELGRIEKELESAEERIRESEDPL